MILIITALMIEAAPIIEHFKLKRDMSIHAFPVYRSSEISLIVSGVGKIKSAMAAVYLLSTCGRKYSNSNMKEDKKHVLINIGFCGAGGTQYEIGSLLLINKITDMDTGIDYYPDIFVGDTIPKETLRCYSKPVHKEDLIDCKCSNIFCDMDSAGIMEAAKKFTYAHQVVILKVISDYLSPENLNKELLKGYIIKQIPRLEQIISELKQLNDNFSQLFADNISLEEEKVMDIISENLRFTQAMRQMLYKEIKRSKYKGMEPLKILDDFMQIKVNSKTEGKKLFEQIIAKLK